MDATSYLLGKKAGGGSGTSNYNDLSNKPSINGVTLSGDKSTSDLGIVIPTVPTNVSAFTNDAGYINDVSGKQDTLVSGTNIKTINNESILGSGNITISGGGGSSYIIKGVDGSRTITNYNTAENRAVFKEIYDNYENITEKNVYYLDTTYNRYIQCSGIRLSGTQLRLYIDYTSLNQTNYYGVSYQPKTTVQLYGDYSNGGFSSINKYDLANYGLVSPERILGMSNTTSYTPTEDYNPATKKYVDNKITSYTGYDATKTQVLKNVNGTLTWVDE